MSRIFCINLKLYSRRISLQKDEIGLEFLKHHNGGKWFCNFGVKFCYHVTVPLAKDTYQGGKEEIDQNLTSMFVEREERVLSRFIELLVCSNKMLIHLVKKIASLHFLQWCCRHDFTIAWKMPAFFND